MKVKRWKLFSLAGVSAGILAASVALAAASSGGGGGNGSSTNGAASSGPASSGGSSGSNSGGSGSQAGSGAQGGTGHSTNGQSGGSHSATNTADRPATSSNGSSGANGLYTSGSPSSCGKGNAGPCPPPTGPPNGPPNVSPVGGFPPITTSCGKTNGKPCPVGPNGLPPSYPPPMMSTNVAANDVLVLQPNQTSTYSLSGFAPGSVVTIVLNGQHEATSAANGAGTVFFTASCAGSSVSINGGPAVSGGSTSYAGSATDGATTQGFTVQI